MKRLLGLLCLTPIAALCSGPLQVGELAPDFSLPASTGKSVSLAEFRGKKSVVLAFFPKAFTGG